MLSYKLLQAKNNTDNFQEIEIQDFYITDNKTFIGGYVDNSYNIYNNKTVFLWVKNVLNETCNNMNLIEFNLFSEQVQLQGKVSFATQLPIYTETVYNLNDNSYKSFKYVKYRGYIITNEVPYGLNTLQTDNTYVLPNTTPIVQNIQALLKQVTDLDKSITLLNDYVYIENGKFEYKGQTYTDNEDFYLLSNLKNQKIIASDGTELTINIFDEGKWNNKTKVTVPLFKDTDIIKINTILRVNDNYYNSINGLNFYSKITSNGFINSNQALYYQSYKKEETVCEIYMDVDVNKQYIIYNNERYYAKEDFYYAIINNEQYNHIILTKEIAIINSIECYKSFYNGNGIVYVCKDDMSKGFLSQTDLNLSTTSWNEISVFNLPSITIDETIYPIFPDSDSLTVNELKKGQIILLKLNNEASIVYTLLTSNLNEQEIVNCTENFFNDVNNNLYWFYYNNLPTYNFNINNNKYYTSISDFSSFENDNEIDDDIFGGTEISFVKNNNFYKIALPISINLSTNQNQEELISNDLFDKEKESSINDIIDMEKDIYYPCINNGNNKCNYKQDLTLCNSLIFNLHFRTRDLETWEIDENKNWFVSDNYDNFNINRSDLLGFLKFNDKDVFYQKNKLKKSFLRLSFYDSPNPSNQNLLYYSTVFINERNLYNKYIKNINTIDSQTFYNILTNTTTSNISVNTEYENKNNLTEDKRLSCQMQVDNMFQTTSSSDGYYIYLYRDFSLPFESRSIYMKAEFNHAGIGKTLQFMLPRKFSCNGQQISHLTLTKAVLNNNTEYEVSSLMPNTLLDNKNNEFFIQSDIDDNLNNFSSGFEIQDIYYQQYIEFKIIYDEINNRYCYYLPFNSYVDNNMILNLFELKLK